MGGVLITLVFAMGMEGLGRLLYGRWMAELDLAAKTGIAGILGPGTMGLLTLFIGLLPNGLQWGMGVAALCAALGWVQLIRDRFWAERTFPRMPKSLEWLFVLAVVVGSLFALVAVLTPSNSLDWDTIAYHLAVPKLWLKAGHIYPIVFIHHSNFPDSVDNLYIWGLTWGGQAGAKAFQLCFYIFGLYAVFGLTKQRYGSRAASWAALTFAMVPAVLWEGGSGYIDVAHGLFTGLGVVLAAMSLEQIETRSSLLAPLPLRASPKSPSGGGSEIGVEGVEQAPFSNSDPTTFDIPHSTIPPSSEETRSPSLWPLAGLCLGFAAGSKYTGLQALIAAVVVIGGYLIFKEKRRGVGQLAGIVGLALVVCCPWYIKNILWTGNPVYPFFYEQFGGKYWSQFNANIYREQQQIFGVPRTGPAGGIAAFPESVMGLAFQPSRYTDPNPALVYSNGQFTGATGFWFGAIGGAVLSAGFVWMFSGKLRRFEGLILGWVGFSFLMWFFLSQQSRYAISFVPILAMLLGAGAVRLRAGPVLAFIAAGQAAVTLFLFYTQQFQNQVQVALGKVSEQDYLSHTLAPYRPFQWLNQNVKGGTVALYDEVFGFYLDVPYFWANPGHCTVIGYDQLNDGPQFVARLKQLGFTYIYLGYTDHTEDIEHALGVLSPAPLSDATKSAFLADPRTKYKFLICDAGSKGLLKVARPYRQGVILQIP